MSDKNTKAAPSEEELLKVLAEKEAKYQAQKGGKTEGESNPWTLKEVTPDGIGLVDQSKKRRR